MRYGELPTSLGIIEANVEEMFFYQYLPVKLAGQIQPVYEDRLKVFDVIIGRIACHFIGSFGLDAYKNHYMYVTAKHMYQKPNCEFNRPGWHSDGYLTNDINYIWCNNNPTTFNTFPFKLSADHELSLTEMEQQAMKKHEVLYADNEILMLNQYNIHRVTPTKNAGMRAFLKVSFSLEKYNLIGNTHNPLIDYNWEMKPRKIERNHPIA